MKFWKSEHIFGLVQSVRWPQVGISVGGNLAGIYWAHLSLATKVDHDHLCNYSCVIYLIFCSGLSFAMLSLVLHFRL